MTGRDLIIYILQNNLEDEVISKDGFLVWLLSEKEVAAKFDVGLNTVRLWFDLRMIQGIKLGNQIFFPRDVKDPRKEEK